MSQKCGGPMSQPERPDPGPSTQPVASRAVCGRFVSSSSPADLATHFGARTDLDGDDLAPRYNVAPTDDVMVVHEAEGRRRVEAFHWGLVPFWAKDPKVGSSMINARSETVASKGAFKEAFSTRRALVPADGFYEWARVEGARRKQAYFVHPPDGEPYAFAALWAHWRGPERDGTEILRSTTIITTEANGPMSAIHDRMPVMLARWAWDEWLDPAHHDVEALQRLLVPGPSERTALRPVGPEVGNVRNEGPSLVEEVAPEAPTPAAPALPGFEP